MKTLKSILLLFLLFCCIIISCEQEEYDLATVRTLPVTQVGTHSAMSGGVIKYYGGTSALACGVSWDTMPMPNVKDFLTNDSLGTDTFRSHLINLIPGTIYYVRAYVTNAEGTAYGNQEVFTTTEISEDAPSVFTDDASSVSYFSAVAGGWILNTSQVNIIAKGVCWNTVPGPSTSNSLTNEGSGDSLFVSKITNLQPGTTYYFNAYIITEKGTYYGDEKNFTTLTLPQPEVETGEVTNITATSAECSATVTTDSLVEIISKGICYSLTIDPTLQDLSTDEGPGPGTFTSTIYDLEPGKPYYVRAYATTCSGITYGTSKAFDTHDTLPEVITTEMTSITAYSAIAAGSVNSDGGDMVTSRGFCWSENTNPSLSDNSFTSGDGTGVFLATLEQLNPNTTYYVRSFATNSNGTVYGNELIFATRDTAKWWLVFSDDFESYTTGSHPSSTWTTRFSGVDAEISEDVAYEGSKSFMLSSSSMWARVEAVPMDSIPDELMFEGAMYVDQAEKGYFLGFGFKESTNTYRYRNGVGMSNQGKVNIVGTDTTNWSQKTWYKFKAELNFTTNTVKLWIDNQFIAEVADCLSDKDQMDDFAIGGFNFSGTASKAYYDDIKLYFKNPDYYQICK